MPGSCWEEEVLSLTFGHLLSGDLNMAVHSLSPLAPVRCLNGLLLLLMAGQASRLLSA